MRNSLVTQIVTHTKIVTPFMDSRKCDYYEWGEYTYCQIIKDGLSLFI